MAWSQRSITIATSAGVLVVLGVLLVVILHRPASPLPAAISKQVRFAIYFPGKPWIVAPDEASYQNGVLRFGSQQAGKQLVFTEQTTPPVFSEVPQYFPALLAKMNQYASFGSASGTVYLTKPTELKGGQTAVVENAGTLLFVRPGRDLSDNEWRQLFSTMRTIE